MPETPLAEPSLRQLHVARVIADCGSLTAAARVLNRTQPALSKSLKELETHLGVSLFHRFSHGMAPTAHGTVLLARIREAEAQFEITARALSATRHRSSSGAYPVLTLQVNRSRLEAFLAVHAFGNVGRAAKRLGTTRAAVYDSLRCLEGLLGISLFDSSGAGLRASPHADTLATHVALALSLIRHGLDELHSLEGAARGQLIIGTLPYSRAVLVPRAIDRVLSKHPRLQVRTREGPYEVLELALRNGAIDLIVGATRKHRPDSTIWSEPLFEDQLAVLCGSQHPLASQSEVTITQMLKFDWILPLPGTPARQLFEQFLLRHGASEPERIVETGSLSAARGLLLESNRLALLSAHQVRLDLDVGLLATLPVQLEGTFRPIGVTFRAHNMPSLAARVFLEALREISPTRNRRT